MRLLELRVGRREHHPLLALEVDAVRHAVRLARLDADEACSAAQLRALEVARLARLRVDDKGAALYPMREAAAALGERPQHLRPAGKLKRVSQA